ncbi:MAG: hypothetical protein WBA93_36595 [Microcoleaceae cyanobacterium]
MEMEINLSNGILFYPNHPYIRLKNYSSAVEFFVIGMTKFMEMEINLSNELLFYPNHPYILLKNSTFAFPYLTFLGLLD